MQHWWVSVFVLINVQSTASTSQCPHPCACSRIRKGGFMVDCSNRHLQEIPKGIPPSVTKLNLDRNLLTRIQATAFGSLLNLTELHLKDNKIVSVDPGAFNELPSLTSIYLSANQLRELEKDVFKNNIHLSKLHLTGNKFMNIPDFKPMPPKLSTLNLDTNRLTSAHVPPSYSSLSHIGLVLNNNPKLKKILRTDFSSLNRKLTTLKLARCNLNNISKGALEEQPLLTSLSLSYNDELSLKSIKAILDDLYSSKRLLSLDLSGTVTDGLIEGLFSGLNATKLRYLHLDRNNIPVLPKEIFSSLPHLYLLLLKGSKLTVTDPEAFAGLSSLKRLDLSQNRLQAIPENLPKSLQKLDLSYNEKLSEIPHNAFVNLNKLTTFKLTGCGIAILHDDSFIGLGSISELEIDNNVIPHIPDNIFKPMPNIQKLSLSQNKLVRITNKNLFQGLVKLDTLNLKANNLEVVAPMTFHTQNTLRYLDLSGNNLGGQISSVTSGSLFSGLQKLQHLDLSRNGIFTMPNKLFEDLEQLKSLMLQENKITSWGVGLFNHTKNLTEIQMQLNQISLINQSSVAGIDGRVTSWNLLGNPFSCSCDLRWFRRWINSTSVTLVSLKQYICHSPAALAGVPLLEFDPDKLDCWHMMWYYAAAIGVAVALVLLSTVVSVLYYKRWQIRYRWFMFRKRRRTREGEGGLIGRDFTYTAYICHSEEVEDCEWVEYLLLPKIEDQEGVERFKLCYDKRDHDLGKGKAQQIFENIDDSKFLLIAISNRFYQDPVCQFVLTSAAPTKATESPLGMKSLILVILETGADLRVPKHFHQILENNEALTWTEDQDGQKLFWQKLKERLAEEPQMADV